MKDKYTLPEIEQMLASMNVPGDFAGKDHIWQRVNQPATEKGARRLFKKPARVVVIVAALCILAATVVTAAGQLMYGSISVSTTDNLYNSYDNTVIMDGARISYPGQQPFDEAQWAEALKQTEYTVFTVPTLEDARDILAFDFKTPAWAPEGYTLQEINLSLGELGIYDEALSLKYVLDVPYEDAAPGSLLYFTCSLLYVGPNASLDIITTGTSEDVQFVEINGVEAVVIPSAGLHWIQDGIAYSLPTYMGVEQAIHMAESIV